MFTDTTDNSKPVSDYTEQIFPICEHKEQRKNAKCRPPAANVLRII